MTIKQRILPEFHSYAKRLEKIKRDVKKIIRIAALQTPAEDRLDDIAPCLKRILEQIVYGCLEVQIPVHGKRVSTLRWQKSKASDLVKKVNPKFYPNPLPDRGGPYVKITSAVQDSDALTQEKWLTAWAFVNQIQHVQNPASERHKPDPQKALDDTLKWTQRAINLLSYHSVIATNTAFFVYVILHPQSGHDAQVEVMERVTSWSPAHKLPNGGAVKLQTQGADGEWHGIKDPKEGEIAFMRLHGIYTHHGFFKPRS
ncbi:MAG: hypothetical protein OXC53_12440 [Rhodobacteraceae bacterium]|nr:hypothetical protein [Paracoccaceae bacterium]